MSFIRRHRAGYVPVVLGVWLSGGCGVDALSANDLAVPTNVMQVPGFTVAVLPLELACGSDPTEVIAGDVASILPSEPFDPSQPQAYGSESCAGIVFEFDNPDEEPLSGAWIQASGDSSASEDALSASRCGRRTLETEYWGYEDRAWSRLDFASSTAVFEPGELPGTGYCRLEALIEHAGTFEKLRVVARVTDGTETYPMYATVW